MTNENNRLRDFGLVDLHELFFNDLDFSLFYSGLLCNLYSVWVLLLDLRLQVLKFFLVGGYIIPLTLLLLFPLVSHCCIFIVFLIGVLLLSLASDLSATSSMLRFVNIVSISHHVLLLLHQGHVVEPLE